MQILVLLYPARCLSGSLRISQVRGMSECFQSSVFLVLPPPTSGFCFKCHTRDMRSGYVSPRAYLWKHVEVSSLVSVPLATAHTTQRTGGVYPLRSLGKSYWVRRDSFFVFAFYRMPTISGGCFGVLFL